MSWGRLVKVLIISWSADVMLSAALDSMSASWPHTFLWGCSVVLGAGVFLAVDAIYPREQ